VADEFDTYVAAVVTKLKTIDTFGNRVLDHPPDSVSGVTAAVIMDTGEAAQRYTQKHGYKDTLLIRCYIPIGADRKTAEKTARQLWTDIVSVFTADVDVGATIVVMGRLSYDAGYVNVGGVFCRALDVRPESLNILTTTYG